MVIPMSQLRSLLSTPFFLRISVAFLIPCVAHQYEAEEGHNRFFLALAHASLSLQRSTHCSQGQLEMFLATSHPSLLSLCVVEDPLKLYSHEILASSYSPLCCPLAPLSALPLTG
ncbi:hypothetical protein CLU79DRAFT_61059 [Phycomyces nitens]|nr:hypothetical protein CLU79DRAFT_61059 [Phycomyces nitens]